MIWWCRGCGMEDVNLRDRCPSCGSAMQSASVQWLEETDDETVFELELEPVEHAAIVESLMSAGISHRWDTPSELVVSDAQADLVDGILDEVLGADTRDDSGDDVDFDDDGDGGDETGYESLSELYLITDQLRTRQDEDDVQRFMEVSGEVLMSPTPFGIDEETWADVQSAARNVAALLNKDEEDPSLDGEIVALRNQLKILV